MGDISMSATSHDILYQITTLIGWRGVDFNWGGLILIRKGFLGVVSFNILQCEAGF